MKGKTILMNVTDPGEIFFEEDPTFPRYELLGRKFSPGQYYLLKGPSINYNDFRCWKVLKKSL